jgi:hypothetical protein
MHYLMSAEWPAVAGYLMIYGPPSALGRNADRLGFALACAHVAVFAFQHSAEPEPRGVRVMRYLSFALLSVCWMYVIGIYRRRITHVAMDSAVFFAVYFWPILYIHAYASVAYSAVVFVFIVAYLRAPPTPPSGVQQGGSSIDVQESVGIDEQEMCARRHCCYAPVETAERSVVMELQLDFPTATGAEAASVAVSECEESMEDLERAFRLALQSKAGGAAL